MKAKMTRKARKQHCCTVCQEIIDKGSEYIYLSITPWDHHNNDGFAVIKMHLDCNEFANFMLWWGNYEDIDYFDIWSENFIKDKPFFFWVQENAAKLDEGKVSKEDFWQELTEFEACDVLRYLRLTSERKK